MKNLIVKSILLLVSLSLFRTLPAQANLTFCLSNTGTTADLYDNVKYNTPGPVASLTQNSGARHLTISLSQGVYERVSASPLNNTTVPTCPNPPMLAPNTTNPCYSNGSNWIPDPNLPAGTPITQPTQCVCENIFSVDVMNFPAGVTSSSQINLVAFAPPHVIADTDIVTFENYTANANNPPSTNPYSPILDIIQSSTGLWGPSGAFNATTFAIMTASFAIPSPPPSMLSPTFAIHVPYNPCYLPGNTCGTPPMVGTVTGSFLIFWTLDTATSTCYAPERAVVVDYLP